MKLSQTRIAIVLAILVATSSGCGVINRIRAKNQLNEAARAYREGHFEEAEQHSRRALELDPNNKTAPMFIARTLHAQYRPGVQSPENLAKAQAAIEAYQRILANDPKNNEAYKTILLLEASKLAEMEGDTSRKAEYQKQYEAALKRTTELSVANQKRKEEEAKKSASPPKG